MKPEDKASEAGAGAVSSELVSKAFMDDNYLAHFGNYLHKIGKHIALDISEAKDWVAKAVSSSDENTAAQTAADDAEADVAHESKDNIVMAPKKKKILILMSDTGGGHRASANAIKAALLTIESNEELEVKIVDVLEDYTLWFSNRLYTWYVYYPVVWATIYNATKSSSGKPWPIDTAKFLEPTVQAGFRRCIAAEQPDLVLSVHPILQCIPLANFMPANPKRPIPFLTCVTDLGDAHPWWFNPAADRLFVPTEAMKEAAETKGVKAERIDVTGLPLRQGFWNVDSSAVNKKKTREKLQVGQDDRKVVLVMGGGDGMGKLEEMVMTLCTRLAAAEYQSHIVLVCGRNAKLEEKLLGTQWTGGCALEPREKDGSAAGDRSSERPVLIRVLGFVSNVEDYMVAAHLIVTKAGPGSIAEAAACALPIMLFDFLPGQEEANVDFVRDCGMGGYEETPDEAARKVVEWLGDESGISDKAQAALRAARPLAARDIAERTLSMLSAALAVPARAASRLPASAPA